MSLMLACECGHVVRGEMDELVRQAQDHARDVHRMALTKKLIVSLLDDGEELRIGESSAG